MTKTFTIWVGVYNSRGARMFYGGREFPQLRSLALQQGIIHSVTTRVSRAFQDVHADKLHLFPICDQIGYYSTCSPVRPDLPKKSIAVFADLGSPDQDLRNLVAFDCRLFTKVCERSRAVKNQQSFVTTKCWYSQSLQVDGRCKASTCWRRRSSVAVISFRVVFSQPAALVGLPTTLDKKNGHLDYA